MEKLVSFQNKAVSRLAKGSFAVLALMLMLGGELFAQNAAAGAAALNAANASIRTYFAPVQLLIYAIGAIVGLVGAVKVFQKWSSGDSDTTKVAMGWGGALVFLVIAGTAIGVFFGVA